MKTAWVAWIYTLAAAVSAQNTTCIDIDPEDTYCHMFRPAQFVLYKNQAADLNKVYLPMLSSVCKDTVSRAPEFPMIFCLGAMGRCNGGDFKLPRVKDNGMPEDFEEVTQFYNSARFADMIPSFKAKNVKPPCYSLCRKATSAIIGCKAFQSIKDADPCKGLPESGDCLSTYTPLTGSSSNPTSSTPSPDNKPKEKPSTEKNGAEMMQWSALVLLLSIINL